MIAKKQSSATKE